MAIRRESPSLQNLLWTRTPTIPQTTQQQTLPQEQHEQNPNHVESRRRLVSLGFYETGLCSRFRAEPMNHGICSTCRNPLADVYKLVTCSVCKTVNLLAKSHWHYQPSNRLSRNIQKKDDVCRI
jgi:LSD1 subclass zinc finger protein